MRAGQTNPISVNISVDLGTERSSVWHYTDVHPFAMIELLSRHCELLNFPVFSPPFNSCSVTLLYLECACQTAPRALECAVQEPGCPRVLQTFGIFI